MSAIRVAIDVTELDADGVVALLTHAVGTEDRDRLDVALLPYRAGSAALAVARSSRRPVGVIGYSAAPDRTTLLHLATDPACRQHGIGTALIHWVHARHPDIPLTAETDADAVRFYENTGFTSTSLGEKYPGVERFLVRRPPIQLAAAVTAAAGTALMPVDSDAGPALLRSPGTGCRRARF
ncbi:GNAT family N-acetyltransferase [Rhodococcus opacus]|uniref:GNAT family N-acetyltransferase n=1 Tax=Rhodococcus opacus TaxID=37919 RepID=UPI000A5906D5|nr:GNAT family N-acetyltransferase [Rhodococcus opacus]UDH01515.1 GNAT family N-acetyltransferase [Rhodococcus opacus PD630]